MKKNLRNSNLFRVTLLVTGLLFTGAIFAQTIGNGQTLNASDAGATVTIQAGGTLNMNVAKTFTSITTSGTGLPSTISNTGAVTVSGAVTVGASNTLSIAPAVTASQLTSTLDHNQTASVSGTGSLSVSTITMIAGNNDVVALNIGSSFNLQAINISATAGNPNTDYTISTNGILKISGTITGIDHINCNTGSSVEYNGVGAQTVYNTSYENLIFSGNGTKTPASALTIQRDLTISAGTFSAGNFTHNLKGNWINNGGVFTPGAGTINFNGTAAQTIGGTQPTTFGNITFANTGGITLAMPTTITGLATFTSGVITSDATNVLIFNDNATSSLIATNAATSSYVNGPVRKVGNDPFVFPIGAATGFVPLQISAPDNTSDAFTAQYFRGMPVENTDITVAGISQISACDYWNLTETNNAGAVNNIDATFYWNANNPCTGAGNYVTDPTTVKAVHYSSGSWSAASAGVGSGTSGSGSVIFAGLTTFSPFALGSTSSSANPLPVQFANVKAYEKNSGVQIEWSNMTEKDVAGYAVERSANGKDFTAIGDQLPTSNQNDKADYTAFDASPVNGVNYYRIKAQETTGKIVYSKVLSVNLGKANRTLSLYPNPVSGKQVTISLSDVKKGQYNLRVVNTAGQDVYKQAINNNGSTLTQILDLPSSVKPGVYNMVVTGDDYRESKMFIVQ